MPVPRRRHCPARRDRARTHKKLQSVTGLTKCDRCESMRRPHHVCPSCGYFKGRFYGRVKAAKAE